MADTLTPQSLTVPRSSHPRRVVGLVRVGAQRSAAIVLFLLLWEIVPRTGLANTIFLPPFSEVAASWFGMLVDGQLWDNLFASLVRSLVGLGLSILIGVPLGLLIGWYRRLAELLNPLLELFRNTAALAIMPVFVLLLGLGEVSKIALVLFACAWPIILNTVSAVRTVDPLLVKSARSLSFSTGQVFRKVVLPASVPTVFTGIRLAAAAAVLVLVAAEMVGATAGLGYLINAAQYNFEVPQMYAGIVTISLLGVLFNQVLVLIERRISRWNPAAP